MIRPCFSHQRKREDREAAFASLAGVNPIPPSSGNTVHHRINRGGDRRLNRALHMAILTRIRMDPRTRAYVERRTAEGRTPKEIRRCLKRFARRIYRHLNAAAQNTPARFDRHRTINGRLEHLRGSALGFRNLTNYIARSLLESGGFRPRLHLGL